MGTKRRRNKSRIELCQRTFTLSPSEIVRVIVGHGQARYWYRIRINTRVAMTLEA
jgi:hypothetical protein